MSSERVMTGEEGEGVMDAVGELVGVHEPVTELDGEGVCEKE